MSYSTPTPRHPVLGFTDVLEKALVEVTDADPMFMSTSEKTEALGRLTSLISRAEALRLRVVAAADDVAAEHACRRVADWVARQTRTDKPAAHAHQRLAEALDTRWTRLAAGITDGRVHLDQARVIVKALDALPAEVGPEVKRLAEDRLVAEAEHFGPRDLARLGARILTIVAPAVGDDHERRALERAEQRAEAATRLTFKRRGDGATDVTATLPDLDAARFRTYLDAFTSPRQGNGTDPATGARLPADQQRGHALCALLERLDPTQLPSHGGLATTLTITMPLDTLTSGLGTAQLGTGETITAGQARRLACTAGLVPAVLGSNSEILDLGRLSRLFTAAQRRAKAVEDPECRAEGCSVPAAWCDAHHATAWANGGKTDLKDCLLLCNWHHTRAHDTRYQTQRLPNGDLRYHRRT